MEELCTLLHSLGVVWRENLWKDSQVSELIVSVKALIYMINLVKVPNGWNNGTKLGGQTLQAFQLKKCAPIQIN